VELYPNFEEVKSVISRSQLTWTEFRKQYLEKPKKVTYPELPIILI
jgi:hypothetical protein